MSIVFRLPLGPFLPRSANVVEKRVLLVRDDVIGDLLVPTSAVVSWLVREGYEVYLVLRKELMDIGRLLLPIDQLLPVDIKQYRNSLSYRFNFLKQVRGLGVEYAVGSTIHSSVNEDIVRSSGAEKRWGYKRKNTCKENFRLRGIAKVDSLPVLDVAHQEYTSVVEHERHFLEIAFGASIATNSFGPALYPQAIAELESCALEDGDGGLTNCQEDAELLASNQWVKETCPGETALAGQGHASGCRKNTRCGEEGALGEGKNSTASGARCGQRGEEKSPSSNDFPYLPRLPQRYIHYLAEAGAVKRVFPPERLLPIVLDLAESMGMKVVLTGLKRQEIEDARCLNLTGRTTLPEVLSIVAKASAVVGNESGLTHLAWVLGKKTALFYGGGHWGRFRPQGDVLLLNAPCEFRCCDWKCRYETIPVPCVNLEDAEVATRLAEFLKGIDGKLSAPW